MTSQFAILLMSCMTHCRAQLSFEFNPMMCSLHRTMTD